VAAAARGYSGAEIDAAVQTAMYAAYSQKTEITTEHLLNALRATVPLSTTRAEEIEALRTWARDRAVPASCRDADAATA
jgi:SpoVK/Ycf46/Vps4 family AAA+-type ATPase